MQESLFEDGKDPQAFRTIGEVSAALDIKPHVLRYWEEQFPMLRPVKRSGGRRYYRPGDVELLQRINRLLHDEGYTIRGAIKAIEDGAAKPAPAPAAAPPADMIDTIRSAVRTLEEGASEEESAAGELAVTTAVKGDHSAPADLAPRLRALREKLATALLG